MTCRRKLTTIVVLVAAIAGGIAFLLVRRSHSVTLQGAVIAEDTDLRKQSPIPDVEVTAGDGMGVGVFKSDPVGMFRVRFRRGVRRGDQVKLRFTHPEYQPVELEETITDRLFVVRMPPVRRPQQAKPAAPEIVVGNVHVRYALDTVTEAVVGGGVKTFQVVNTGNVPCNGQQPCSPGGKWKAAIGSAFLDAGEGNEFRNARVSCIAGPCPFTRIETDGFSNGGPLIKVSVRNWSDTTTFLMEAEVIHRERSNTIQRAFPVILGEAMNFTLPSAAQGPSLEAEINGVPIVFPLDDNPFISWVNCESREGKDHSRAYRCELRPGYRFQNSE
ncbi:MAG: carboxypeptidase regulatory-like domain-containing protein [Acidobacteria bacterium]|nr:carboxypeptidase regulatory-like domain-containing protein [Acidobacteriota bacterium]